MSEERKYFSFSQLQDQEKEKLEFERKQRAKREGRDLLDNVMCLKKKEIEENN